MGECEGCFLNWGGNVYGGGVWGWIEWGIRIKFWGVIEGGGDW